MLRVPSLKPIRLRGVACAVDVDDVRPKPSCDQRITAVPRARRAKLRMTWKATCGSFAHACTHRSPPERSGCSASPGSAGNFSSAAGRCAARPNRSSNRDGPKPTVTVSAEAGRPTPRRCRSAGCPERSRPLRSAVPWSSARRPRPTGRAWSAGRCGRCGDVEGREREPVLGRGGDAGLVARRTGRRSASRRRTARPRAAKPKPAPPAAARLAALSAPPRNTLRDWSISCSRPCPPRSTTARRPP